MERREASARSMRTVGGLCLVAGLLLTACRATPEPPPPLLPLTVPTELELRAGHYAGTALGGPRLGVEARDVEADPARMLDLELTVLYLRLPPEDLRPLAPEGLRPLAGAFELALDLGRATRVLAAPRLFEGALLAEGEAARALFEELAALPEDFVVGLAGHREVLGEGMAFELDLGLSERVEDPDNFLGEFPRRPAIPKGLRVALDARAGNDPARPRVGWSLSLEGALPTDPEEPTVPDQERYRPGSPAPAEELLRPDLVPTPGVPLLALVPAPFDRGAGRTLALLVSLEDAGEASPERDDAIARALASIDLRAAARAARLAEAGTGDFLERTVPEALGRLERLVADGGHPRSALLFLAGALDAQVSMDALLALSGEELVTMTAWLLEDDRAGTRPARWSLELHAWKGLLAALGERRLERPGGQAETAGAPSEPRTERTTGQLAAVRGLVLRHAGEVGRFPRLLEALLNASVDEEDLAARLAAENRVFLEDSSPAARVRAYDWLSARGLQPADYDPLAERGARRAALEAAAADAARESEEARP